MSTLQGAGDRQFLSVLQEEVASCTPLAHRNFHPIDNVNVDYLRLQRDMSYFTIAFYAVVLRLTPQLKFLPLIEKNRIS